ncbi:MAG: BON domain-containing protein [Chitinivibrionales bacterium]|nr:BON domain-containing protein [Chitinivibrionales bacterium]
MIPLLHKTSICLCIIGVMAGWSTPFTDQEIKRAAETFLEQDQAVSSHLIDVRVQAGIVTLQGKVDNLLSRDRAADVLLNIAGVRGVINRIKVHPVERSDLAVRDKILQEFAGHRVLGQRDLHVEVEKGLVALRGAAGSQTEKKLALYLVKGTAGVIDIIDKIVVNPPERKSDGRIKREIDARFDIGPVLADSDISISVHNGEVHLSGLVDNVQTLNAAIRTAGVQGATLVDAGDLTVTSQPRKSILRNQPPARGDSTIKQNIEDAFFYDPRLLPSDISVEVSEGDVTLKGLVISLQARKAAAQTARHATGADSVVNNLRIRRQLTLTDFELEQKVIEALKWDPYLERFEITVWLENAKAYLYGHVDNHFEKERAWAVVSRIAGITDIENRITVRESEWSSESDYAIESGLRERLRWNTHINERTITFRVEDGIVTLKGEVATGQEYQAALTSAFNAGAKGVQMDVDLEGEELFFLHSPYFYSYEEFYSIH